VSVTATNDGTLVTCQCTHLTEFAVLARDSLICLPTSANEKVVYGAFSILYLGVAVAALVQLGRVIVYTASKCTFDLMAGNLFSPFSSQ
jgi:hypothetical protein